MPDRTIMIPHSLMNRGALIEKIDAASLPTDRIAPLIRPCVEFLPVDDSDSGRVPGFRLGGMPWLPPSITWPTVGGRPLSFIAQIDLSVQPSALVGDGFPSAGHLLFFFDIEGFWLSEEESGYDADDCRENHRVLFLPDDADLEERDFPDGLSTEYRYADHHLQAQPSVSLPPEESVAVGRLGLSVEERDRYHEISTAPDSLWSKQAILGGYPDQIQGDLSLVCAESCAAEERALSSAEEAALHWRQLLQVPSTRVDGEWQMKWGDVGCLYFYLVDSDLRAGNFDRTCLQMQF